MLRNLQKFISTTVSGLVTVQESNIILTNLLFVKLSQVGHCNTTVNLSRGICINQIPFNKVSPACQIKFGINSACFRASYRHATLGVYGLKRFSESMEMLWYYVNLIILLIFNLQTPNGLILIQHYFLFKETYCPPDFSIWP